VGRVLTFFSSVIFISFSRIFFDFFLWFRSCVGGVLVVLWYSGVFFGFCCLFLLFVSGLVCGFLLFSFIVVEVALITFVLLFLFVYVFVFFLLSF